MLKRLRRFLIGERLPNWEFKHQKLSKTLALAVFSSDSLSSVAYATEEILIVLVTAGVAFISFSLPIAIVILLLLWILIVSYRQTIEAYPNGGGAYIVAKENLGKYPGLIAAAALLLDYILTAAVSVAAGVAAVTSAFPELIPYKVAIGVFVLMLVSLLNLKGVKESGVIFSVPTYMFIVTFFVMIGVGFYRYFAGQIIPFPTEGITAIAGFSLFLLLRAFSSGSAALTGIEAVSNGVPAFKKPASKNAKATLLAMAIILSILFFSITFLALQYHITPTHDRTVVSILAEGIFGKGVMFFIVQLFTMLILFLAANTSFADFPRLCFFLAKDKYLPNQFKQLGDRLVFSTGIIFLGVAASLLIIFFGGSVHHLIPLYAIGVFTSFTLSQVGMVKKNLLNKGAGGRKRAIVINSVGSIMTFIALVIITITKFSSGAWTIVILLPLLVLLLNKIHNHYTKLANQLSVENLEAPLKKKNGEKYMMIVMVASFHKGIIKSVIFAKAFCKNVKAVHIDMGGSEKEKLLEKWEKFKPGVELVILDSPYRVLISTLLKYLDEIEKDPKLNVTIIIPEFVPTKAWHHFLHNQTGLSLKTAIHFRRRTSYISVQYHLDE
ncbi:MAG: APC family permease [Nanoarchaeota archaeon]|mgnify:CR=1 FL=1